MNDITLMKVGFIKIFLKKWLPHNKWCHVYINNTNLLTKRSGDQIFHYNITDTKSNLDTIYLQYVPYFPKHSETYIYIYIDPDTLQTKHKLCLFLFLAINHIYLNIVYTIVLVKNRGRYEAFCIFYRQRLSQYCLKSIIQFC